MVRIASFSANLKGLVTGDVSLASSGDNNEDNYFTVIVGNNGVGKTRFLNEFVEFFRYKKRTRKSGPRAKRVGVAQCAVIGDGVEYRFDDFSQAEGMSFNSEYLPAKIIAMSLSLSDKFPRNPSYFRRERDVSRKSDSDLDFYSYIGLRDNIGNHSSRYLLNESIRSLVSQFDREVFSSCQVIFEYLCYEPVIRVNYKIQSRSVAEDLLSGVSIKSLVEQNYNKYSSFKERYFMKVLEEYSDGDWEKLDNGVRFIVDKYCSIDDRDFSFILNFSPENVDRLGGGIWEDEASSFEVLNELRRFDLVRSPEVVLYKKSGGEFNFQDASSGEACILSSLLSLSSSVVDNSLVVIDEPEISLHPTWQSKYINLVDRLLSYKKGCHVIIATHSHFLVSDLPLNRSSVVHFKQLEHDKLKVESGFDETLGRSAEDILLNVFGMPSTRNYYVAAMIEEVLKLLSSEEAVERRAALPKIETLKELVPHLNGLDPFRRVIEGIIEASKSING